MLSVITPVLNGSQFIEVNISSVMDLKIPFEHIIVDGGSTDGTQEIVRKFPHIKLMSQKKNDGMYGAINQGIRAASGQFVCYLNCDDKYLPGFNELYEKINAGGFDLVYGDAFDFYLHSQKYKKIKGAPFGKYFLRKGILPFCQSSSIFSKSAFVRVQGFQSEHYKICGDLDFFRRVASVPGARIKYLPVTASVFLKYGQSLGDLNNDRYRHELNYMLEGRKVSLMDKNIFRIARRLFT